MQSYDPEQGPDAEAWLELDEQERILEIARFHRRAGIRVPNATLHASTHAVIENQLAMGVEPVRSALARLQLQGQTRHDALHAIGLVLAERIFAVGRLGEDPSVVQARYEAELEKLGR